MATMQVLLNSGDNILIPRPGFPLIETSADNLGAETRYYDLLVILKYLLTNHSQADKNFESDIASIERQIDERTKAIYVINPSNPCGMTFSKEHQLELLRISEKYKVPILADEVYFGMTYPGKSFHPFASLSSTVPLIVTLPNQ